VAIDRALAKRLGIQLRIDSIRCTTEAGSGHPTSSMSAADLMAVLLVGYLRYDWRNPSDLSNDRLIFSKGHASPLLYSIYKGGPAPSPTANYSPCESSVAHWRGIPSRGNTTTTQTSRASPG